MKATALHNLFTSPPPKTIHLLRPHQHQPPHVSFRISKGLLFSFRSSSGAIRAVERGRLSSIWDEKPYELLEEDVVTFLDPPKELIPLDPDSYNPAAYLWSKIEDIAEERRLRLLSLIKQPRLISRAWEIAGMRYEDAKLAKKCGSDLLCCEDGELSVEFYSCRSNGGGLDVSWMKSFKMVIFRCGNAEVYGRFIGGSGLAQITKTFSPLYFKVAEQKEVMSTEQPCDLAYEFGDGHLDLCNYPRHFPRPEKHPYPFDDQVVIYIRHVGPGVLVGQAWQEGKELQQVPQKLCDEILMVKDYAPPREYP
ncbi:WD repeat protein [Salix suchowensis]|nr:WD repeat protein [Salix suchowensis]